MIQLLLQYIGTTKRKRIVGTRFNSLTYSAFSPKPVSVDPSDILNILQGFVSDSEESPRNLTQT